MNESMTMWSLIANASVVVKLVMLVLMAAVFTSWVIIVQRHRVLKAAKEKSREFEDRFWSGMDLSQLYREITQDNVPIGVENIFAAGFREFSRMRQQYLLILTSYYLRQHDQIFLHFLFPVILY